MLWMSENSTTCEEWLVVGRTCFADRPQPTWSLVRCSTRRPFTLFDGRCQITGTTQGIYMCNQTVLDIVSLMWGSQVLPSIPCPSYHNSPAPIRKTPQPFLEYHRVLYDLHHTSYACPLRDDGERGLQRLRTSSTGQGGQLRKRLILEPLGGDGVSTRHRLHTKSIPSSCVCVVT